MVQFIELIAFVFTYGLKYRNKCEVASIPCFCFPTDLLNIELLYLTTYSPNLNLIERLWKFVKKKCLYSVYYPDFSSFKFAISSCLAQSHTTHKLALDSLLTLRFQSFKNVKSIPS
jgi:transposase